MLSGIAQSISMQLSVIKQSPLKTTYLLTAAVFLTSLLTYLMAIPEWFFDGESWGLVLKGAQCTGLGDFLDYFLHGKVNDLSPEIATNNPAVLASMVSAGMVSPDSFFTVLHRPMLLAFHAIQYYFFDIQAYGYFACIVVMHATIAALLFYLLSKVVHPGFAFLCSLFFTFHPMLYGWFGRIDTQQNQMNLLLMLALFIVLKKYWEKRSLAFYLLACIVFFFSLLTRETLLVLPIIIFLWSSPRSYGRSSALLSGFCIVICLYLFIKSIAYPIILSMPMYLSPSYSVFSPTECITGWVCSLYNFFWLQWFPWPTYEFFRKAELLTIYKFIKLIIILSVVALFITNKKQQFIMLSMLTAIIMSWPSLIAFRRDPRLFYESLPFVILTLAYLLNYSTLMSKRFVRYASYALFALLIGGNGYAIINSMRSMATMPKKFETALKNLKQLPLPALATQPLMILNAHGHAYACGIIQAIELHGINSIRPRYFLENIIVHRSNARDNIDQLVCIKKAENSIRLISLDPEKIWFQTSNLNQHQQPTGIKAGINQTIQDNHIIDLSLNFETDFYHPDLMIMVWFFEQEQFVILKEQ